MSIIGTIPVSDPLPPATGHHPVPAALAPAPEVRQARDYAARSLAAFDLPEP